MTHENFCSKCPQNSDCKAVYEQLGNSQGPNIVWKAITAFLLPIAVFIATLAILNHVLVRAITGKNLRTMAGFALAAGASFVCILIVKALNVRLANSSRCAAGKKPTLNKIEGGPTSRLKAD